MQQESLKVGDVVNLDDYLYREITNEVLHELKSKCIDATRHLMESGRIVINAAFRAITFEPGISDEFLALIPWACKDINVPDSKPWSFYRGRKIEAMVYFDGDNRMVRNNTVVLGVEVRKEDFHEMVHE